MNESQCVPEFQLEFRAARDCMDHIFVSSSLIQVHLSPPRRKDYACFVAFKRAFPSVNHDLLWSKLLSLGVRTKLIKIVKSLYDAPKVSIRKVEGLNTPVDVNCGVIQGELLSLVFFILTISDLEDSC
ncbi:uncharacterized protein LOC117170864 [Belonocnema kinseyi]|uniref:uncharacterized protein LOC117170864 n=1 Tax=Belonocnema kinseyi TaxID=2817044 RepID=UPI00143D42DB|nr:uncharacterized protein LOC117170864 [Belonocnema kinseyi]